MGGRFWVGSVEGSGPVPGAVGDALGLVVSEGLGRGRTSNQFALRRSEFLAGALAGRGAVACAICMCRLRDTPAAEVKEAEKTEEPAPEKTAEAPERTVPAEVESDKSKARSLFPPPVDLCFASILAFR